MIMIPMWLYWGGFLVAAGVAYQTLCKIVSVQIPALYSTAAVGFIVMSVSLVAMVAQSANLPRVQDVPSRAWAGVIILGLVTWGIEFGYIMLYKAHAPLSISRVVIMAGTGLVLLAIGILMYHEHVNRYQLAGVFAVLVGLGLLAIK